MPAKKTPPPESSAPAGPAKPAVRKSPAAKKTVPAKPVKPVAKSAAKPAAKKVLPAKQPAGLPAQADQAAVLASPPEQPTATAVPSAIDQPAAPVSPEPVPTPAVPAEQPAAPIIPQAPRPAPAWDGSRPGLVEAIAIMTLINGILNVLWGIAASCGLTAGVVTICLVPFALLLIVLGVIEISYASRLFSSDRQPVEPSQTIAILEICAVLFGNVISLVVGILALVFYNDPHVKAYFARLNARA